jgi:alginate O-acetyltransferase complex protein AlgI
MAIGLGKLFGVTLPENFNQPFTARSIGDFWRRWHMSLTAWFREYVFYPLERHRFRFLGQQINLVLVFILTGLWHGLTGNFMVWGLIHGIAMALESKGFGKILKKVWRPLQTIYVIGIVAFSWIFFRSPTLPYAWTFIGRLLGDVHGITPLPFSVTHPLPFIDPTTWFALGAGSLFLIPWKAIVAPWVEKIRSIIPRIDAVVKPISDLLLLTFFWAGIAVLTGGGFMPGIYDKF